MISPAFGAAGRRCRGAAWSTHVVLRAGGVPGRSLTRAGQANEEPVIPRSMSTSVTLGAAGFTTLSTLLCLNNPVVPLNGTARRSETPPVPPRGDVVTSHRRAG